MKPDKIKEELQKVKGGNVRHFGFIKGKGGNGDALAISTNAIGGPVLSDLQKESGNKGAPIVGEVRYDLTELMYIFETNASPAALANPLREAVKTLKLPIPRLDVRPAKGTTPPPNPLGDGQQPQPLGDGQQPTPEGVAPVSTVAFTQARTVWDTARKSARGEIDKVKAAVAAKCRRDPNFAEIKDSLPALDDILINLDDSLCTSLAAAAEAPDAKQRGQQYRQALETLVRYRTFLTSDPVAKAIDKNGFVPVKVHENLLKAVTLLEGKLK